MVEFTMPDLAAAMRAAVRGLVDRLDTEQRRQLVFPFDGDRARTPVCAHCRGRRIWRGS
jgi:hypothetical protein